MNEQRERAELEALLASTLFARAPDLSKILRHVCERRFANQADSIKEYSIAVEALGRSPDFRPEADSIVRVQAARLRKHLKQYYETDGADHPIQIRFPATGYKPEFIYTGAPEGEAAEPGGKHNGSGERAGGAAEAVALETPLSSSVPGESDSAASAEGGVTADQPGAHSSRRKLVVTLAIAATVTALAVVAAMVVYRLRTPAETVRVARTAPAAPKPGLNIRAGFSDPTFLDATGNTWLSDRYFTGGEAFSQTNSQIRRTYDQSLYQTGRRGNFSYAIPLQPGVYELHLHFAETFYALTVGADTQRTFDVSINGAPALIRFDISKDAGGVFIADEKIFKDISPGADGLLRLEFLPGRSYAVVNGIEVLPAVRGKMLPVRILCSNHSGLDRDGGLWQADRYFSGGRIAELTDAIRDSRLGAYSSYRTGNFDYAIPVAEGAYRLRLMFAEPVRGRERPYQGGTGSRLFDVYCNGKTLQRGLDVFEEAGGGYRVVEKTYSQIKPDAQGKIALSFVPVESYAVLLGIEVLDENW